MTKWELGVYYTSVVDKTTVDPSTVWQRKGRNSGTTAWQDLSKMAADGWELVAVTPIADNTPLESGRSCLDSGGNTQFLMYTFKRPLPA